MDLLKKLSEVVKSQINNGNEKGIPVPLVRDPKNGRGSVSLTLTFLSFNLCLFGTVAKITNLIGEVDMTNALWLFGICASLYFGRKLQIGDLSLQQTEDKEQKKDEDKG